MRHGFAQVIANFAFELCRTFDNGLQRTVFIQPFHRCFGTHFRHTRDVIHGVANQRKVIANACRIKRGDWVDVVLLSSGEIRIKPKTVPEPLETDGETAPTTQVAAIAEERW